MFTGVTKAALPYAHPWSASIDERRRALVRRSKRIAYIYGEPDTSTFRYRVFNMVEALDAAPELEVSATWFTHQDIERDNSFVDSADAVVLCRVRFDGPVGRLISRARARGIRVLFDIDDLIFDASYAFLVADILDARPPNQDHWDKWYGYIARLGATLLECDAAIATNTVLAERMKALAPQLELGIVPNFLNRLQTEASMKLLAQKRASAMRRTETIDLGYFSGSPSHNRDLGIVAPALATLLGRFSNIRLRLVGFIELSTALAQYHKRIEVLGLLDFLNLQRVTAEVELALAPLQKNVFTDCKSELKYFEAGIVGVPTMASPTTVYSKAISHGENGFLAHSHEWLERLTDFIGLLDRRASEYEAMCERVVADAEQRYAWNAQAPLIARAVFGPAREPAASPATTADPAVR